MLLGVCAGVVALLHLPLLSVPYYWDEAGYYVPAARDFYLSGSLIPYSTVSNPHPPLLSVYLAGAWRLFGFSPVVTRLAMAAIAGAAVYAVLLLAMLMVPPGAGLWAALLTALAPVFFAQSTLAHLDVAATAGTLLCIYFYLRGRIAACAVCAALLCLVRETGAVVVLTLAVLELCQVRVARRETVHRNSGETRPAEIRNPGVPGAPQFARRGGSPQSAIRSPLLLLAALLPLAVWFVYLRWKTGLWLGDRHFAEYNVWGAMNPVRWLLQFGKRLYQLCIADFRWAATVLVIWGVRRRPPANHSSLITHRSPTAPPRHSALAPRHFRVLLIVAAVYTTLMSIVGGAALTRYLLPVFPLLFLLAAEAAFRLPRWPRAAVTVLLPAAFVASWFWNPAYPFSFADNLAYVDFVRAQQAGARMLEPLPPETRILTTWPAADALLCPWLGYVSAPRRVVPIRDFSERELAKLSGEEFDAVLFFSREWKPEWYARHPLLARVQIRYFGYRPQVSGSFLGDRFGLQMRMRTEIRGQWVEIWVKTRIRPIELPSVHVENRRLALHGLRYLTCKSGLHERVCGQSDPA